MYIDKLDDIVNKYNNTYHSTIKIKPVDVTPSTYITDSSKKNNNNDPEFKTGDIVRISNYKNTFAKACVSNWFEEAFVIREVKNTVPWTYVVSDLKGGEIVRTFYFTKSNCRKQIKKSLELKKKKSCVIMKQKQI